MFDLNAIQSAIRSLNLDGWLLYDFRGSNILARRILQFADGAMGSRRCMYFIPANGTPRKLVHRIESSALDHLPGDKTVYLKWQEYEAGVASLTSGLKSIAMEYSPRNGNPYISRVDGGTIELVRSNGVDIYPSGDLVQMFEAVWEEEQWAMHQAAGVHTNSAYAVVWKFIADQIRQHGETTEAAVRDVIMDHFAKNGLTTYHPPIVGVNANSGDPHYETGTAPIRKGDFVLVDLWAKLDKPRAVYSDLTRVGFVGETVPDKYESIFQIVAAARDAAIKLTTDRFAAKQPLQGYEVDDACRAVIEKAGYGQYFVHRTGHSIGQEVHGNGANMDNLETHETRRVLPGCCFSVEPGIYQAEFGVRSEVDVFVDLQGNVHVTAGELQRQVVPILKQ
eukprot:TRINITY_DN1_c1_g1_i5.p3 TRINITY_DN1_c1_g1~~TRINITY_DN1_c1_g1_i5.p3  ORF type:complete len:393 (-),score=97.55 TRINITY_DN1_c1_g1_i5:5920-7098(-)